MKLPIRYALCILFLSLATAFSAAAATEDLFRYDAAQPLQISEKAVERHGTATIHDITFADAAGSTVTAYLVRPEGHGAFGLLKTTFPEYGHGIAVPVVIHLLMPDHNSPVYNSSDAVGLKAE